LEVLGVVLIGPEDADNRHAIERYSGIAVIGHIPVLQDISREALVEVFTQRFNRRVFL